MLLFETIKIDLCRTQYSSVPSTNTTLHSIIYLIPRSCTYVCLPQVHELDFPAAVLAVLRRDVHAVPVAANAVAHRGDQGARVHAAVHVPGARVRASGARPALRPRRGDPRGVRAPAHHVPAVRVPRAPRPVLLRHVRDAHVPGQALGPGEQGRQHAGVAHVPGARLDRHVPGRLPVRHAHGICNNNNNNNNIIGIVELLHLLPKNKSSNCTWVQKS